MNKEIDIRRILQQLGIQTTIKEVLQCPNRTNMIFYEP